MSSGASISNLSESQPYSRDDVAHTATLVDTSHCYCAHPNRGPTLVNLNEDDLLSERLVYALQDGVNAVGRDHAVCEASGGSGGGGAGGGAGADATTVHVVQLLAPGVAPHHCNLVFDEAANTVTLHTLSEGMDDAMLLLSACPLRLTLDTHAHMQPHRCAVLCEWSTACRRPEARASRWRSTGIVVTTPLALRVRVCVLVPTTHPCHRASLLIHPPLSLRNRIPGGAGDTTTTATKAPRWDWAAARKEVDDAIEAQRVEAIEAAAKETQAAADGACVCVLCGVQSLPPPSYSKLYLPHTLQPSWRNKWLSCELPMRPSWQPR